MNYQDIPLVTGRMLYASLAGASIEQYSTDEVILTLANGYKAHVKGSYEFWKSEVDKAGSVNPTVPGVPKNVQLRKR